MHDLNKLKAEGNAPEWMTLEGYQTLAGGYLLEGETPKDLYQRLANTGARIHKRSELAEKFFDIFWRGWLGPATPVASNLGTERGLPISCFSTYVADSKRGIAEAQSELMYLSAAGGGTSVYMGDVRAAGSPIRTGGVSEGVIPWLKIYDSTILATSQGATRRGACAAYLPVDHGDFPEFLRMRRPQGDVNKQCLNLHHGATVRNEFMRAVKAGGGSERKLWAEILKTRFETGEPYLFFYDNVNDRRPQRYKELGLEVRNSNLCTEILAYIDELHSFVCCLSSLNLAKWHEWKNTDTVQLAIWFLDAVMQEFIDRTEGQEEFKRVYNFAVASRMLGLGVMGWHSLLQQEGIPFESEDAYRLNKQIFRTVRSEADKASRELYKIYGGSEWADQGYRHSHRLAVAPTVSNSAICGGISAGIEPWRYNFYIKDGAKGKFTVKNPLLLNLLKEKGIYSESLLAEISERGGSVQWLKQLSDHEKAVFKTAVEIDQNVIIEQAADRQVEIDQGQSLNLFFDPVNTDPKTFNQVHYRAWELGLPTLYYVRSDTVLKADKADRKQTAELFAPIGQPLKVSTAAAVESVPESGFCPLNKSDDGECLPCQG